MKHSVLLISNHASESCNPGQIDALRLMRQRGEIDGLDVIHAGVAKGESDSQRSARVARHIASSGADVIIVLSMKDLVRDMDAVGRALQRRPVLYWEGDPWGRGKRVSEQMAAWLEMSSEVFSVGGHPQAGLLMRHGARKVHHTIHTYDHVLFGSAEQGICPDPTVDVAFLGTNASRMPVLSGLPGSFQRWLLVSGLLRTYGKRCKIAGRGWPAVISHGEVPFDRQHEFIQSARVLSNWDHYPKTASYVSDRLAVAMISGRVQVTTRHPDMHFLPGRDRGLFLEPTVSDVLRRTRALTARPDQELLELGMRAHRWAKQRISHRQAMRHMLSVAIPGIERPPGDPWDLLPGPWRT
ncbi:MAG: hypothetical protein V9G10_12030 [Candidatus Nanopelagicales bacterium]